MRCAEAEALDNLIDIAIPHTSFIENESYLPFSFIKKLHNVTYLKQSHLNEE